MGSPATILIYDDLTTSESCITLWTIDNKFACWIDVKVGVAAVQRDSWLAVL